MIDEKLQFAISQYVDGVLPPEEKAQLEVRLASDGEARAMLEEYRRLDQIVKSAGAAPEMDWDAFSRRISAAVDAGCDSVPLSMVAEQPAWRWWRPVALAAGLLLCVTAAVVVLKTTTRPWDGGGQMAESPAEQAGPVSYAMVDVFRPEQPASTAEVKVEVGQADQQMVIAFAGNYPELTSQTPARVLISAIPLAALADEDLGILH